MTSQACRYAVVRFVPYPESEEFANIGILMAVPKANRFLFQIENSDSRYKRFFNNLPAGLYKQLSGDLRKEYEFIRQMVETGQTSSIEAFERIVAPRSNMIAFGGQRTLLLKDSPEKELDRLFNHYVHHSFTRKDGHEMRLKREVRRLVEDLKLDRPFVQHTFRLYQGTLPIQVDLAQMTDDRVTKVIKPLYFDLSRKDGLWDHADKWIPRLQRLKREGELPKKTLLPVEHSTGTEEQLYALNNIKQELGSLGTVIQAKEHDKIRRFAMDD